MFVFDSTRPTTQNTYSMSICLTKVFYFTGREFYDRIITVHKGKLERAKQKLDKICTIRTLMPHYFDPKIIRELKELDNDDM